MEDFYSTSVLERLWIQASTWFQVEVIVMGTFLQLIAVLTTLLVAWRLGPPLAAALNRQAERPTRMRGSASLLSTLATVSKPVVWLIVLWLAVLVGDQAGWPIHVVRVFASLVTAWLVIRLVSGRIRNEAWSTFIGWSVWTIAALNILGLLHGALDLMDSIAMTVGDVRVSVLTIGKGVVSLAIFMWIALSASGFLERRISSSPNLTPSVQVLFGKLVKIVLISVAFLVALDTVGIDLTAFAVFGGALGVGIGFGLQKIIANLVSGVILLLDKSIKPGDVITVGDTYGWIASLGARYASVRTRDGTEHLIPNEELITQRVENWSHTDRAVRLKIPVGVHYDCDLELAMRLCREAAAAVPRILRNPETRVLLKGFGDSSVDLEVRVWVDDPQNGRANVMSDVLVNVWNLFHQHGIEIPYPQRDLHLKSSDIRLGAPG